MFYYCDGLRNLNLSSFDTSNVTNMSKMFLGCINLTRLNLSSFDTSNVTDMNRMFYNCQGLQTIYISTLFDVMDVTNFSYMFYMNTKLV
jgi:surface protein